MLKYNGLGKTSGPNHSHGPADHKDFGFNLKYGKPLRDSERRNNMTSSQRRIERKINCKETFGRKVSR